MKEPSDIAAKLKQCDSEIQNYVTALEAENLKLQKQIAKLQAENMSAHNRIEALEQERDPHGVRTLTDEQLEERIHQYLEKLGYERKKIRDSDER